MKLPLSVRSFTSTLSTLNWFLTDSFYNLDGDGDHVALTEHIDSIYDTLRIVLKIDDSPDEDPKRIQLFIKLPVTDVEASGTCVKQPDDGADLKLVHQKLKDLEIKMDYVDKRLQQISDLFVESKSTEVLDCFQRCIFNNMDFVALSKV